MTALKMLKDTMTIPIMTLLIMTLHMTLHIMTILKTLNTSDIAFKDIMCDLFYL